MIKICDLNDPRIHRQKKSSKEHPKIHHRFINPITGNDRPAKLRLHDENETSSGISGWGKGYDKGGKGKGYLKGIMMSFYERLEVEKD